MKSNDTRRQKNAHVMTTTVQQLFNYNDFFVTRDHLRPPHLDIVPYTSGVLKGQSLPRDFAHDALGEVVPQTECELLVVHAGVVCDLPPELSHFGGALDLKFEFSFRPLYEVGVGRDEEKLEKEPPQLELRVLT